MRTSAMEDAKPGIALDVARSDDIHAQASLLDTWNQHYSQLSRGAFLGGVTSLHTRSFRLFAERMNRAVLQQGDVGRGRLGFGIATRMAGSCNICGEVAGPGDLLVFSGDQGFEFLSPDGFEFIGLEIKSDRGEDAVFAALVALLADKLQGMGRAIALPGGHSEALAEAFRAMLDLLGEKARQGLPVTALQTMQRQLVGTVIDCLDAAGPAADRSRGSRRHWQIVRAIRENVLNQPDCPLSVAELSLRLAVSRRTLQNAVAGTLRMSPVSLLRALRLSETRRELPGAASVTEVATRWGFWHFGHFARDYRAMFGELPSETLRRGSGLTVLLSARASRPGRCLPILDSRAGGHREG